MDNNDDIKLNCAWDLWFHHTLDDWTIGGYRKIYTITTVGQFWVFFNNLSCIGGINNMHYFLMRQGITPIYEDVRNRFGGTWSLLTTPDDAYKTWIFLATRMIGETLTDDSMSITGLSINMKSGMSVIKIWNNNKSQSNNVQLPGDIPHLKSNVIYRNHKLTY